MPLNTMHDLLTCQLRDLFSAERQLLLAWPQLAQQASADALIEAIELHHGETAMQLARLIELLELLDRTAAGAPSHGMEGILATTMSLVAGDGEPAVIDAAILATCIRALSYQLTGYANAVASADALGTEQARMLLDRSRGQVDGARRRFRRIEPNLLRRAGRSHLRREVAVGDDRTNEVRAIPISSAPSLRHKLRIR